MAAAMRWRAVENFTDTLYPLSLHVLAFVRSDGVWLSDGMRERGPYASVADAIDDHDTKRRLRFGEPSSDDSPSEGAPLGSVPLG